MQCYQEYLRGPCQNGEKYEIDEESFDAKCVPHNCGENETEINEVCFQVTDCESNKYVEFDFETQTTSCLDLNVGIRQIIRGVLSCPEGQSADARGKCRKTTKYSSRPRRNIAWKGCASKRAYFRCLSCRRKGNKNCKDCQTCGE